MFQLLWEGSLFNSIVHITEYLQWQDTPPPCNNRIPRKSNEHNLYNTVLRGPLCSEKPHEPVLYDLTG